MFTAFDCSFIDCLLYAFTEVIRVLPETKHLPWTYHFVSIMLYCYVAMLFINPRVDFMDDMIELIFNQ